MYFYLEWINYVINFLRIWLNNFFPVVFDNSSSLFYWKYSERWYFPSISNFSFSEYFQPTEFIGRSYLSEWILLLSRDSRNGQTRAESGHWNKNTGWSWLNQTKQFLHLSERRLYIYTTQTCRLNYTFLLVSNYMSKGCAHRRAPLLLERIQEKMWARGMLKVLST